MQKASKNQRPAPEVTQPNGDASLTRRRLLRGSLSAAPVLMVSAPRSVLADTFACKTGSAFTSLNPSGVIASTPQCSGHLPEYWTSCSLTYWPGTCLHNDNKTKLFNDVFGSANGYPNARLLDVLSLPNTNAKDKLAKYVVASLLNARKGLTPAEVLNETTVREIWAKCSAGSFYEPTAGIKWYAGMSEPASSGGCVAWLMSTMS
jgi:hypothetical protein